MSDESSDPDLAEERYDPEDNLNAYGSPVFRPPDDININEIVEQSVIGIVHPTDSLWVFSENPKRSFFISQPLNVSVRNLIRVVCIP
ncbi:Hypothetical predicted protein [Paramuricea clavata]|uniref:Uncharacterized protein n=1 Tax=Paramuricea clavata TaxID=317549 RepID=A0A6S7HR49_PARCT|nr:Hypothetical predicted protein [Paramuricea clavata]